MYKLKIAETMDEIMACFVIRTAASVSNGRGRECPDRNDHIAASFLLAYSGSEPVGTIRIRLHAGNAYLNGPSILPTCGHPERVGSDLVHAARLYAGFKGCTRLYASPPDVTLPAYRKVGFRPIQGGDEGLLSVAAESGVGRAYGDYLTAENDILADMLNCRAANAILSG